jgi:hypothetical protein
MAYRAAHHLHDIQVRVLDIFVVLKDLDAFDDNRVSR